METMGIKHPLNPTIPGKRRGLPTFSASQLSRLLLIYTPKPFSIV